MDETISEGKRALTLFNSSQSRNHVITQRDKSTITQAHKHVKQQVRLAAAPECSPLGRTRGNEAER